MKKSISVIVPICDDARHLPSVLPPLLAELHAGNIAEILIVDDGSRDNGPELCREAGLKVLTSGGRRGPSSCRNHGAQAANGDVLLFVDGDVVLGPDVPARIAATFERSLGCVATFGSYNDRPGSLTVVSLYKNLLNHMMHQRGRAEAKTFWSGCGAVDRKVFLAIGGFDTKRFPRPSIEDIELGARLLRHGHIMLDRDLQVTHLKQWTIRRLISTDVFRRALPWSRLMMEPGYAVNDLNIATSERLKAVLALAFWASLVSVPFFPSYYFVACAIGAAAWLANQRLFRLVMRRGGVLAMLAAFFLHQLYYLYSSATYAYCVVERSLGHRGARLVREPREAGAPSTAAQPTQEV